LIPVHLFGQCAEMDELLRLSYGRGLAVIEDAAQALGARYKGRFAGTLGTLGIFSFFPSKNLGGFGDGGMLVTDEAALAAKARSLRMHGETERYHHAFVGGNFRMDPLQAALLSVKFAHYDAYTKARQANAAFYTGRLAELPGVALPDKEACGDVPWPAAAEERMLLPVAYPENEHIWNQYTLRVRSDEGGPGRRDALRAHLAAREIASQVYYPVPLHRQACFAEGTRAAEDLTLSERLADEVLSIPVYPELNDAQREELVEAVASFARA
jgi:dTDP-4-amino-4,6-dideoxygalactose transaminase